ncbi:MAG: glycosyltransferase [Candidatus Rokubacteria bacterium]|nr:glycosyltransferase [Candidatus Rokubacteria bacterium]
MSVRIAVLSVHTCPLAALGGKETGGMNVYVREVARELSRMGVAVDVFTRSQNAAIPRVVDLAEGARVIHLAAGPEKPLARETVYDHLDEFTEGVDAWRIARGVDYDLIHAHYWLSGVVGLALRERWGTPVLQMFHTLGRLKNRVARGAGDREPDVRIREEARIIAAANRIVAANAVERAHLVQEYGADARRIAVIPCGVDTDLFRPGGAAAARAALGLDAGPLLLYVGRLAAIKGLDTLLDAVALLRRRGCAMRLVIAGGELDEPLDGHEAVLREQIARLGLTEVVRFVGPQTQERLREYYVAADLAVLPSYYESFGMVALEAMACATPVVASRVGGLTTTVRDGVTGFLVPEGDVVALANRLDAVVDDADLRWRIGREGVRWAAQHRWPCVAEAVCREYAALQPRAHPHLAAARCLD